MKKSTKYTGRKKLFLTLLIVLILGIIIAVLEATDTTHFFHKRSPATTQDGNEVNLNPPSDEEKASADAQKEAIVKRDTELSNAPQTTSGQKKQANIVISGADSTVVRGYLSNVFEEGGTCTATAKQGSQTYIKSSVSFQNVSYTQCAPIEWDAPLGSGAWVITLTYSSTSTEGSLSRTINIQ